MKIIIGSDFYYPSVGGTEVTTANLAKRLTELGHDVLVVAPATRFKGGYYDVHDGVRIYRVSAIRFPILPNLYLSRSPYKQIKGILEDFKPNVVQVNNAFGIGTSLIALSRKQGIPVVAGNHFMFESFLFPLKKVRPVFDVLNTWGWRWIAHRYRHASVVVGPTTTANKFLLDVGLIPAAEAISNGIDIETYRPAANISGIEKSLGLQSRPRFIYIGRVGIEKRLDVVIKAFAKVPRELNAELIVAGSGNAMSKVAGLVKNLRLADRVVVTGYLKGLDLKRQYLAVSDVFVIASPVELQSIVVLEAMAMGKPVIAVRAGALPELVRPGDTGELFDEGDDEVLANQMIKLIKNKALIKEYGIHARALAEKHDIRDMPLKYIELYKRLIRR